MNTANSSATVKRKAPPKAWKKGESGNPKGAPKRGESWAEIIKRIGDMTPIEAAQHAQAIAGKLKVMGDSLTLKEAVVVRVYAALLFEPQASLLNSFMERAEGKVTEPIDLTSKGKQIGTDDEFRSAILSKLASITAARGAGGVDKPTE
jgi:hypothetical protein